MRVQRSMLAGVFLCAASTLASGIAEERDIHRQTERSSAAGQLATEVREKGWIAFSARTQSGDWDLFLCRPDGSSLRNLTGTPQEHEIAPRFSPDGRRMLYRRLPLEETVDGNRYGAQGQLVLANSDGSDPQVLGQREGFAWASWSPDGRQIACLDIRGVFFVDVQTGAELRRMPRKGFFQQLSWSPDGRWLGGVTNAFGASWSVGRIEASSGAINAVSRIDSCTPDWFPDSRQLIFSYRPPSPKGDQAYGWTQLWMADGDGSSPRLVFGEDGRHVYGGHVSPDGKYVLFTGNAQEDGDPENAGAPMGLVRLADTPIIGGASPELRSVHPEAASGPILVLPAGFEPCWTFADIGADNEPEDRELDETQTTYDRAKRDLAAEVQSRGWIAFSAQTDRGDWDLLVSRPDGSQRRQLTDTPEFHEIGVRFSPSGNKILYHRLPRSEPVDNNTYGNFQLIIADADGSNAVSLGEGFAWADWGPDERRVGRLRPGGIEIVDLASREVVQRVARRGIVQQLRWSPDGRWFVGTANGLGPYWNIGRVGLETGQVNAVSETERYNCTPDWMPDSQHVIYSRGIVPEVGGRAELWVARGDGANRRMLFADSEHHIYGGCASPDGQYVVFTRSVGDLGGAQTAAIRMALIRLKDTPLIHGPDASRKETYPQLRRGPVLDLSTGYEPDWTAAEIGEPTLSAPAGLKTPTHGPSVSDPNSRTKQSP
jgi:Tol biopolymer transport system component